MSIKIEEASHNIQSTVMAPKTGAPKISIFANKSGFVIPKNKLSGSLVPVFRGGKKDSSDTVNEENTKHVRRKTNWGPDLTQDMTVRKGKALAYQTRVDQITQQLSSGPIDWEENQDTSTASSIHGFTLNNEKMEVLELEKQEAIGEILKLNPNYKPPAGYKPIQKEENVPIPIKEHPGYNFIGSIFGPMNDTHKRLEKETGAKVKVYGVKAATGEKVEVTSADGNDTCITYQEMYVQVSADTYEKVDAAVSLIELLITQASVKSGSASATVSSNDMSATDMGSGLAPALDHFQQSPWLPGSASQNTVLKQPGSVSSMNPSTAEVGNPVQVSSNSASLFRPLGMGAVPPNPSLVSSRPNMHLVSQRPYAPLGLGQIGAPRHALNTAVSTAVSRNVIVPHQIPMSTGTSQVFSQPLPSAWNSSVAQVTNMMPVAPPLAGPQGSHPMVSNPIGLSVAPAPVGFPRGNLSGSTSAGISINQQPTNSVVQSHVRPHLPLHPLSVTPNSTSVGAPRPQQLGPSDFIFQPHRPNPASQVSPRPVSHFDPPHIPMRNQLIQPAQHSPQTQSARPEMLNWNPSPVMQANNRMIQQQPTPVNFSGGSTGPPPPIRPMGFPNPFGQTHPRNFNPAAPLVNPGSYPSRTGNPIFQQKNPAIMTPHPPNFPAPNHEFRPGKPSSGRVQQTYDPFSPTSLS